MTATEKKIMKIKTKVFKNCIIKAVCKYPNVLTLNISYPQAGVSFLLQLDTCRICFDFNLKDDALHQSYITLRLVKSDYLKVYLKRLLSIAEMFNPSQCDV